MEASVFSDGLIIGSANLGIGDYYMGGLFGTFTPNNFYLQEVQSKIQAIYNVDGIDLTQMQSFRLEVKLPDGYQLNPLGGIVIYDIKEMQDAPIEIELTGVACHIIDRYFEK